MAFSVVETRKGWQARNIEVKSRAVHLSAALEGRQQDHDGHCFIVMPFGRTPEEVRWFRGWYEMVIRPAVEEAGYEPVLAATEEHPNAINDEIREHLAFDPMVVVDLAGASATEAPNPNVMYELGIRHALNLPLVMMAWAGQKLPFDISNQRVIMERRELLDVETNKDKLVSFIRSAAGGQFYRPMEAIGRTATLDAASETLGRRSLLGALVREVRDLRSDIKPDRRTTPKKKDKASRTRLAVIMGTKRSKKVRPAYMEAGGDPSSWTQLLEEQTTVEFRRDSGTWSLEQWQEFAREKARALHADVTLDDATAVEQLDVNVSETEASIDESDVNPGDESPPTEATNQSLDRSGRSSENPMES